MKFVVINPNRYEDKRVLVPTDFHSVAKDIMEVNGSRKYLVITASSFVFRDWKQVGNDMIFG